MDALALLKQYVAKGYLLHGSRHKFDIVEARQSRDTLNRPGGSENGVYATTNLRPPLVLALMHPTNPQDWGRSYHCENDGTFEVRGFNFCLKPGYVYILPKDTFRRVCTDDDTEFVSPVSVKPIAVIEVEPTMLSIHELKIELRTPGGV